ncbi:MAG: sugar phosphate isomerase/epimerase family protein, partial [Candidatus Aenigmarchaeota archaeon]
QAHMMFGFSQWYGDFRKGSWEERFKKAKEMGFDYIELSIDYPMTRLMDPIRIAKIKELMEKYGLKLAIHCSWVQYLADPRPEIHEGSLKYVESCMEIARQLDPLYFVFHMYGGPGTERFQEVHDDIIRTAIENAGKISSMGDMNSIPTLIENEPRVRIGTINEIGLILEKNPGLKLCFDICHHIRNNLNLEHMGRTSEKSDIGKWFQMFGDRIHTVHINDLVATEGGMMFDHLPLRDGIIAKQLPEICRMINKSACEHITLEVFFTDTKRTLASDEEVKASLDAVKRLII